MLNPIDMIRQAATEAAERVDGPASEVRGVILDETRHQTALLNTQRTLLRWIIIPMLFEIALLLGGGAYLSRLVLNNQAALLANQGAVIHNQAAILANQTTLRQTQEEGNTQRTLILAKVNAILDALQ